MLLVVVLLVVVLVAIVFGLTAIAALAYAT